MNVVIQIQDQGKPREAIPVRALPWLTSYHFCAQEVADALAHEIDDFAPIHAYRIDGDVVRTVASGEWDDVAVEIERIHQFENSIYEQRAAETKAIPADVFVWVNEWTGIYNESAYGPNNLERLGNIADLKEVRKRTLNLDPHVPPALAQLVMDGFIDTAPAQGATGDAQPDATPPNQGAPTPSVQAPAEPDDSLLATPNELVDAYGAWGLRIEWFRELDSHKWLSDARRKKGHGTQVQSMKPLFCPYAVMMGLVLKVRRAKRIKPDTGWRVLEHKFPKVYTAFEANDPREQTGY